MKRNLKDIIHDFFNKMSNTTEYGEELEDKIQKENNNFINEIINFFMNKFNFLKKDN